MPDVAKYMVTARAIPKYLYPKLFYMPCVVYLLHNCAMKIKSYDEDVDQLIAKVKSATVENKTSQTKFATLVAHLILLWRDRYAG